MQSYMLLMLLEVCQRHRTLVKRYHADRLVPPSMVGRSADCHFQAMMGVRFTISWTISDLHHELSIMSNSSDSFMNER